MEALVFQNTRSRSCEFLELKPRYYLLTSVALGLSFQFSGSRDVTSLPLVVVCLYELVLDTDTRPPLPQGLTVASIYI